MSSSRNVAFDYMYRDAGNYKKHEAVIFRGIPDADLVALDAAIRVSLIDGMFFYPQKVGIPMLNLDEYGHDDEQDVTWNEYVGVRVTDENVTGERTIDEFVVRFKSLVRDYA
jgi:hypothetical protein